MASTAIHAGQPREAIGQFHQTGEDPATCSCPIHDGREREPFTAPLGLSFADGVEVEHIDDETAAAIYDAHHSYVDGVPEINLDHQGITFQGNLVGAITWRFPLLWKKRMRFDEDGMPLPEPLDIREDLPEELWPTAQVVLEEVSDDDIDTTEVIAGDKFVEAARICIGVRMPNLASAALARSQEQIVADHEQRGIEYLRTLVRADFPATMLRALESKGWTCSGVCEPSQAGNRESKSIRERYKWRYVCPVERVRKQSTLEQWC